MKIALAAIIGNEEAVIERFIRSFAPAVDSFYLVLATGNQDIDDSIAIAAKVCDELGKSMLWSVYHNDKDLPHVDHFGNARQTAWNGATQSLRPDLLLWADSDDVLVDGAAAAIRASAEKGEHDVYIMPYHVKGGKQIVMRERLVKASVGSYWQFAIHEQLAFPRDVSYSIVRDAVFLHQPAPGKAGQHERNMRILENELRDAPRNLFYMAQEFFNTGQEPHFKTTARAALAFPLLGDLERYELLLQLAQCRGQESQKLAAEAFAIMPDRREAIALLSNYAIMDGRHAQALQLAERVMDTPKPRSSYWSQNNEWYSWKSHELYRRCLRLNGKIEAAEESFECQQDFTRPIVSVVHATMGRPAQALAIREMYLSRAECPENVEYIFGVHDDDVESLKMLAGYPMSISKRRGAAKNYCDAAAISTGKILVQAMDDCYPPDGWDTKLAAAIGDVDAPAFVAPFDVFRNDRLTCSSIMTRAYMELKESRDPGSNGFFFDGYNSMFCDTENSIRAILDGEAGVCKYIEAPHLTWLHDHPYFNPAIPWDATYEAENATEHYKAGEELFLKRNPNVPDGILKRKESD